MTKYDESDGVWRTVGGRRIFIREGQSLSDAMKNSDKFEKSKKDKKLKEDVKQLNETSEKNKQKESKQLEKNIEEYDYLQVDDEYKSKQFSDMSDSFQKNLESKYGKQQADQINKSAEEYVQNKTAGKINKALREGSVEKLKDKEDIKKTIEDIDKAIDSYQTEQNMKTVRFEDGTNLMKYYGVDLSKFNTDNINNVSKSQLTKEFEKHIGSEYSSNAYTSTSATKTGSAGFTDLPFRMEIDVPKGTNAFVTKNKDEHEIILARGQKMVLKGVEYQPWTSSLLKDVNPEVADKRGKVVLKYELQSTSKVKDDKVNISNLPGRKNEQPGQVVSNTLKENKAYRNAYNDYKKKHPNSKLSFGQFVNMSEGK